LRAEISQSQFLLKLAISSSFSDLHTKSTGTKVALHHYGLSILEISMQEETPQIETSSPSFRLGALSVVVLAFIALLGYAIHERNAAQQVAAESARTAAALKDTRSQIEALTAKLDAMTAAPAPAPAPQIRHSNHARAIAAVHHVKPDPRWKKFQTQLDAQGKAIDDTRQDLASTRTELQGSIATNHQEIVALKRKGERNIYEFDIDKSKQFSHAGPVGVSLRKANTKHQYADLALMVDDREVSKKHLNLYEPAMFFAGNPDQPLEVVINSISKNHIHGYISTPKYKPAELAAISGEGAPVSVVPGDSTGSPQLRRR